MSAGEDYPIAWTNTYGKGRVFYTALGHRRDVWTNPMFQKHLLGGMAWALNEDRAGPVGVGRSGAAKSKDHFTAAIE